MSEQPARDESVTDINMKFENGPNVLKIKENHPGHFNFSAVKLKGMLIGQLIRLIHLRTFNKIILL